jgi:hypothetical protein
MERDAAFAAVPRLRVNFYFVNEHDSSANRINRISTKKKAKI